MNEALLPRRGIGLLGGTFDPVHAGHLALARAALAAVPLLRVDMLPAGDPWQKGGISDAEHRLCMLRLAVEYEPRLRVNTAELRRSGATYTVDTLREMRAALGPSIPLVLILGRDQWLNLTTWHEWRRLADYADIAWCSRAGVSEADVPPEQREFFSGRSVPAAALTAFASGRVARFEMAPHRASATAIRRTLASRPFAEAMKRLDGWLPVGVAQYIGAHRLYQNPFLSEQSL